MSSSKKQTVLFLCVGNSARSQLAEALLRHKAGAIFDVYSAGTDPIEVDPRTQDALKHAGIDSSGLYSKHIDSFQGESFDYVITLCDKSSDQCRSYPHAGKQLSWDFADPKSRPGLSSFSATLRELSNRISMFLYVEGVSSKPAIAKSASAVQTMSDNEDSGSGELLAGFELIEFYKVLTDEVRLKTVMLTHYHGELCVCELMEAMNIDSQPKVSRNLAILKKAKVLTDRKYGQWVFYRINPDLPLWVKSIIAQTTNNNALSIKDDLQRLDTMRNRPEKNNCYE